MDSEETAMVEAEAEAALSSVAVCCLLEAEAAARVFPTRPAVLESDLAAIRPVRQAMAAVAVAELLVMTPKVLSRLSNRRKQDPSLMVALARVAFSGVDQAGATAAAAAAATMAAGEVAALPVGQAAVTSLIEGAAADIRM